MSKGGKGKLVVVIVFVLAMSAGVVMGLAARWRTVAGTTPAETVAPPPPGRSWLSDQLDLTPAQSDQIRAIWQEAMPGPDRGGPSTTGPGGSIGSSSDARRTLQRERDEAILKLFTPEQREQYDQLMADYSAKVSEIDRERRRLIEVAVERTKAVLTDPQRVRYEELLKERSERDWSHHRGGSGSGTRPSTRPSSRPSGGGPGGPGGPPPWSSSSSSPFGR